MKTGNSNSTNGSSGNNSTNSTSSLRKEDLAAIMTSLEQQRHLSPVGAFSVRPGVPPAGSRNSNENYVVCRNPPFHRSSSSTSLASVNINANVQDDDNRPEIIDEPVMVYTAELVVEEVVEDEPQDESTRSSSSIGLESAHVVVEGKLMDDPIPLTKGEIFRQGWKNPRIRLALLFFLFVASICTATGTFVIVSRIREYHHFYLSSNPATSGNSNTTMNNNNMHHWQPQWQSQHAPSISNHNANAPVYFPPSFNNNNTGAKNGGGYYRTNSSNGSGGNY